MWLLTSVVTLQRMSGNRRGSRPLKFRERWTVALVTPPKRRAVCAEPHFFVVVVQSAGSVTARAI